MTYNIRNASLTKVINSMTEVYQRNETKLFDKADKSVRIIKACWEHTNVSYRLKV